MGPNSFHDLNVVDTGSHDSNVNNIMQVIKLGYTVIALNKVYELPETMNKKIEKEFRKPNPHMLTRIRSDLEQKLGTTVMGGIKLLSRATFNIEIFQQMIMFTQQPFLDIIKEAGICAICPGNDRIIEFISRGKAPWCDIITYNLHEQVELPKYNVINNILVPMGIYFEINYALCIKSSSLRRMVFKNGVELVKKFRKRKAIILSSGGEHPMDFRSPQDVQQMAPLFLMPAGQYAKSTVAQNCDGVILHIMGRTMTTANVMSVEKITPPPTEEHQVSASSAQESKVPLPLTGPIPVMGLPLSASLGGGGNHSHSGNNNHQHNHNKHNNNSNKHNKFNNKKRKSEGLHSAGFHKKGKW